MERALEIDGWMQPSELEWIYETARSMPPGAAVVEVGSWKGRSTVVLCEGLAANEGARVWAVDTFGGDPGVAHNVGSFDPNEILVEFRSNTARYEFLTLLVSESVDAAAGFEDGSLDWIFIDANHAYEAVLADILVWSPKVKPRGLISGHDFGRGGVAEATLRAFGADAIAPGPRSIWTTRSRPRHRAIIAARKVARALKTR